MFEYPNYLWTAMEHLLMFVGASFVIFLCVLLLMFLSGHIAFIHYIDEDDEDANT